MDIKQVKLLKSKLSKEIFELILNFQQETEVVVNSIDIVRHNAIGEPDYKSVFYIQIETQL